MRRVAGGVTPLPPIPHAWVTFPACACAQTCMVCVVWAGMVCEPENWIKARRVESVALGVTAQCFHLSFFVPLILTVASHQSTRAFLLAYLHSTIYHPWIQFHVNNEFRPWSREQGLYNGSRILATPSLEPEKTTDQ